MTKKSSVTWKQVVEMAAVYPGVVAKPSYGTPGLYVGKQFMTRLRELDVIVLKPVYDDEQRFLMETSPEAFFLTDHYRGSDDPDSAVEGAAGAACRAGRAVVAAVGGEEAVGGVRGAVVGGYY